MSIGVRITTEAGKNTMNHLSRIMAAVKSHGRHHKGGSKYGPSKELVLVLQNARKKGRLDLIHYNMALSVAKRIGNGELADWVLGGMATDGVKGNSETYSYAMTAHADNGKISDVARLWREMNRNSINPPQECYSAMMKALYKDAVVHRTDLSSLPRIRNLKIFKAMLERRFAPSHRHYGYLLRHAKNEHLALDLYRFCINKHHEPGNLTLGLLVFYENQYKHGKADARDSIKNFMNNTNPSDRTHDCHNGVLRCCFEAGMHAECEAYFVEYVEEHEARPPGVHFILQNAAVLIREMTSFGDREAMKHMSTRRFESLRKGVDMRPLNMIWEALVEVYLAAADIEGAKGIMGLIAAEDVAISKHLNNLATESLGMPPLRGTHDVNIPQSEKFLGRLASSTRIN